MPATLEELKRALPWFNNLCAKVQIHACQQGFEDVEPPAVNLVRSVLQERIDTLSKCTCGINCQDIGGGRCRYETMPNDAQRPDNFPNGAIHNGQEFINRLEGQNFVNSDDINLSDSQDWVELQICFRYLVEYVSSLPQVWSYDMEEAKSESKAHGSVLVSYPNPYGYKPFICEAYYCQVERCFKRTNQAQLTQEYTPYAWRKIPKAALPEAPKGGDDEKN